MGFIRRYTLAFLSPRDRIFKPAQKCSRPETTRMRKQLPAELLQHTTERQNSVQRVNPNLHV